MACGFDSHFLYNLAPCRNWLDETDLNSVVLYGRAGSTPVGATNHGLMTELVDVTVSKAVVRDGVQVRVLVGLHY